MGCCNDAATTYHAMDMRVKAKLLPPCVENADDTGCGAEVLFIICKAHQRFSRCIKEEIKQLFSVSENDGVQLMRQCEYDMIVGYGYQLSGSGFHPIVFFKSAALRAVPVMAAMVLVFKLFA